MVGGSEFCGIGPKLVWLLLAQRKCSGDPLLPPGIYTDWVLARWGPMLAVGDVSGMYARLLACMATMHAHAKLQKLHRRYFVDRLYLRS